MNKDGNKACENLWGSAKAVLGDVYGNSCLNEEIGKTSNKQSSNVFQEHRKTTTN